MRTLSCSRRLVQRFGSAAIGVVSLVASAAAQETTRASVDSSGAEGDAGSGWWPVAISADGAVVGFSSDATNFVGGDTNGCSDIFVHDRGSGTTERVSVDSSGTQATNYSLFPSLSSDGRIVAFASLAANLVRGDTNGAQDIFIHDRTTGATEQMSVDSTLTQSNGISSFPSISADGQVVAFSSAATNLVANDTNATWDIFVHDRGSGLTERVSVDSSGTQSNGWSGEPAISADGHLVAFSSLASNLVARGGSGWKQIYVHDRGTRITRLVSIARAGGIVDGGSSAPALSADGQVVAFASDATNLIGHDTNGCSDIFTYDSSTGATSRVSIRANGHQADGGSGSPSLSASGQIVGFTSDATNLVDFDTNLATDVFVHDRLTGDTRRVSVDSSGTEANDVCASACLSADGGVVAFSSDATNLVAGDANGSWDVFAHEICSPAASWSHYGAGFPGTNGVPTLTSQQNPVFGTTITLDVANSFGNPTVGVLFVGFQRANLPSGWGGDLLVLPTLVIPFTFSFGGDSFSGNIPQDSRLCDFAVDLQAIEGDPGAAKGVSFTPGLELVLGR
jgi:Tol biopolymer transport system component